VQYAFLIYETAEAFAHRTTGAGDAYIGAWRAYYQACAKAGIYVGGDPLHLPETGTTVRQTDGKRTVQDGPYANTKEQLAGFIIMELPSLDEALEWAGRCPATAAGAVEVRPLAPEAKERIVSEHPG
jgi:hypothetical protein